jgi:hypothetical protein
MGRWEINQDKLRKQIQIQIQIHVFGSNSGSKNLNKTPCIILNKFNIVLFLNE